MIPSVKQTLFLAMVGLCLLGFGSALAQDICEVPIQTTLDHCVGMRFGETCYGYDSMDISLHPGHPVLENPDRARFLPNGALLPTDALSRLQTAPIDPDQKTWGIALIAIQDQINEDSSTLFLIAQGDVRLQDMSREISGLEDCTVMPASNNMNVRQEPSVDTATVGTLPLGASLPITGRSEDEAWWWVELPDDAGNGWIFAEFVEATCEIDDVPIISGEGEVIDANRRYQSMQAVQLQTGTAPNACALPDSLIAQSQGPVPLWVNKSTIMLDGTVVLRTDPDGALLVESLDGSALIERGTVGHMAIPGTVVRVPVVAERPIPEDDEEAIPTPQPAQAYDEEAVANMPNTLLPQFVEIPPAHDVSMLRNPEIISGELPADNRVRYSYQGQSGYYLTLYFGARAATNLDDPDDPVIPIGQITLVSPLGYVIEPSFGPTLGLQDDRFMQRFPIWLAETGTYDIYIDADRDDLTPFFLAVQGHDRGFCDRTIEREVARSTFVMTYPYWGEAGQTVRVEAEAEFRQTDDAPTLAVYAGGPRGGEFVQSEDILASSDGAPLEFLVPDNAAYFVEVQVMPDSDFILRTTCS